MRRKPAAALAGLAALAALCAVRRGPAAPDVPTFVVRRGALVRRVLAEGNLKAAKAAPISAPGDDSLFKIGWLVEDGARVKKGDVVIRFDPTDAKTELEVNRNAEASTDRKAEKEKAESGAAVANLARDAEQARRDLEVSRTFQTKDPELWSRNEIIESQIDVDLAGRREEGAQRTRKIREEMSRAALDILAIERRKSSLKVERAERDLAQAEVRAPHDGVVVFQRFNGDLPEIGRVVWSGMPLAEIPEVADLEAEVWVLEPDVSGLAPGRSARVVVDAHPGREIPATIKSVDALAKPRIKGVPVQYFAVTLSLPTDPGTMKPGQRISATLFPGDVANVLAVPRQAVFERDGKTVVFRRGKRGFRASPVTLGAGSAGRVSVTSGLADGDVVALRDPQSRPKGAVAGGAP